MFYCAWPDAREHWRRRARNSGNISPWYDTMNVSVNADVFSSLRCQRSLVACLALAVMS